jgi:diguanylate cyclase (GGDEF)-like protein/PAS domain S-box-containing protein
MTYFNSIQNGEILILLLLVFGYWVYRLRREISYRKAAEIREHSRGTILEMLANGAPLPSILTSIVQSVEQENTDMLCSILLLDSQGKHLVNGIAPSLPDFYNEAIEGVEIGMGVGSCGTAAFTEERVIVEDIMTHPYWEPYKELAIRAGLGSCWSQPIRSSANRVLGTFAIYHREAHTPTVSDITLIKESASLASIAIEKSIAEEKLRESETLYRQLTEDVADVVWKTDPNLRITYISPSDERLRGYRADEVIGHHVFEMFTDEGVLVVTEKMQQRQEDEQKGIHTGFLRFEVQHRCKDGRLIWGEVLSKPERDLNGVITGYHGITREITERKEMQDQVRELAFYDMLTKLPNRRLLSDRLGQAIVRSKRSGKHCVLMFLDLDNFKPLNDTHGHTAGDLLLIQTAERLKGCVREIDTVARFGGDEFVVIINELDENRAESTQQAGILAEKIRAALSVPYRLNIRYDKNADAVVEHRCTASIGVLVFNGQEGSEDDLLKQADAAMYQAKEAGRDTIRFAVPFYFS